MTAEDQNELASPVPGTGTGAVLLPEDDSNDSNFPKVAESVSQAAEPIPTAQKPPANPKNAHCDPRLGETVSTLPDQPEAWIAKLSEKQTSALKNISTKSGNLRKSSRMYAPPNEPRKLIRPPLMIDRSEPTAGTEIFQMLHNAIRQETMDLYDIILTAMERANYEITSEEVSDMVAWWKVYTALIDKYMTVEETLRETVNLALNTQRLVQMAEVTKKLEILKEQVSENSEKVRLVMETVEENPSALVAIDLIECVDVFVSSVIRFSSLLEKTLGPFFSEGRTEKELHATSQQVVKDFDAMECQYGVVLLSAWINTKDRLQEWIKAYIKGSANERNRKYIKKQNVFFKEHRDILIRFCNLRKEATALQSIISGFVYKFPALRLQDTGFEWSGALDLASLLGNSVRNELQYLMKILHIIVAHRFANKDKEVDHFIAWYQVFEGFLTEVFSIESQSLFKFFSSFDDDSSQTMLRSGNSTVEIFDKLHNRRVKILETLNVFEELFADFKANPYKPFHINYEKFKIFEEFFVQLVDYFSIQENNFPGLFASRTEEASSSQIKAQLCLVTDLIWKGNNPAAHCIMLSRWMPDAQRSKWYKLCIYGTQRAFQYRQWKTQYAEERGEFEDIMVRRLEILGRLAEAQAKRQNNSIRAASRRLEGQVPTDFSTVFESGRLGLNADQGSPANKDGKPDLSPTNIAVEGGLV